MTHSTPTSPSSRGNRRSLSRNTLQYAKLKQTNANGKTTLQTRALVDCNRAARRHKPRDDVDTLSTAALGESGAPANELKTLSLTLINKVADVLKRGASSSVCSPPIASHMHRPVWLRLSEKIVRCARAAATAAAATATDATRFAQRAHLDVVGVFILQIELNFPPFPQDALQTTAVGDGGLDRSNPRRGAFAQEARSSAARWRHAVGDVCVDDIRKSRLVGGHFVHFPVRRSLVSLAAPAAAYLFSSWMPK